MDQRQFEAWWPEISRRLNVTLTRRGVRPADAADIVQETAVRTLAHWPDVDDIEAFTRWAHTVAWRQCIDAYRRTRGATTVSFGPSHDQAAPEGWGSDRVVEGKLELERTLRAMASLSTSDQAALAAAIAGPASTALDRKQAVREAVRLHRARLRLVGVVTKLGGGVAVSWKGLRKLAQVEAARTASAAVAAVVLLGALTLPYDLDGVTLLPAESSPMEEAIPSSPTTIQPNGLIVVPMPTTTSTTPLAPGPSTTTTQGGPLVVPTTSTTIARIQACCTVGGLTVEYPPDFFVDCEPPPPNASVSRKPGGSAYCDTLGPY